MYKIPKDLITDFNILNWRKRGDLYFVENGHLKRMGLLQRCAYSLSRLCPSLFGSYAERVAHAVKEVIDKVTRSWECDDKRLLQRFYFEKISTMGQRVYGRELNGRVFEILAQGSDGPRGASPQYRAACKAAKVWARLGNFELLGGSCGSYRIFNGKGASLGVCKFSDEEQLSPNNPRLIQKIKRRLYAIFFKKSMRTLSRCTMGQACIAEAMNYRLGRRVDPSLVPETHVVRIGLRAGKERRSSFQLWIQEQRQTAGEFFGVSDSYKGTVKNQLPDLLFDKMAIVDFVLGNHDRHAGNWFILLDEKGQPQDIRLIDGGTSLSPFHPPAGNFLLLRNKYIWSRLPCANRPFSKEGRAIIAKLYAQRHAIRDSVERFYDRYLPNDPENALRGQRVLERLAVLYHQRRRLIAETAAIRSEEDLAQFAVINAV